MRDQRDASVQSSLDSLLLCNQTRELADYPIPVMVTDLSRAHWLLAGLVRLAYGPGKYSRPSSSVWRRVIIYPLVIVLLRIILYQRHFWRRVPSTIRIVYRKMGFHQSSPTEITDYNITSTNKGEPPVRAHVLLNALADTIRAVYCRVGFHQLSSSEIAGYITSTDKEGPLIRVCLLLRAMRRYGVCIEFLIQRLNSGLPAAQTRHWLSFLLREIGDTEAASMISPSIGRGEGTDPVRSLNMPGQLSSAGSKPSPLKYGIIMPTMSDSDVFRSSVLSLLGSDFRGEIVVVEEGNQPERVCESFCKRLPVKYVKKIKWEGLSATTNLGIEQLAPETDIVIWTHNDVLWPPHWFGQLNNAWQRVYDLDKVEAINLGFMGFDWHITDATLYELFLRGSYEDLVWILRAMIDLRHPFELVHEVQVRDMGRLFGLARDAWKDNLGKLHMMTGRFSIAASFTLQTWRDLGGFDPEMSHTIDLEVHHHGVQNRKWNLWINNTPLIHMGGTDSTNNINRNDQKRYMQMWAETCKAFLEKYGWEWEVNHFLFIYFTETAIIYHDEIVNAVNELRFSDIDFIFDDFFERLKHKTLESCELVWCHSRNTCKYR